MRTRLGSPWVKKALKLTLQIVKRPGDLHAFQVLPRRWVVERTLAMIITMSRRLARHQQPAQPHVA